jgi:hypothetical protein
MGTTTRRVPRAIALCAIAVGLGAGSYGIASAASSNGSTSTGTTATPSTPSSAPAAPKGWGQQRSDETPLTGDALSKVTAVAKQAVSGATIVRIETDADGHAKYEAHVIKSDGSLATVYVDENFKFVSVETGPAGGPGDPGGSHGAPPAQNGTTTTTTA